MELSSVGAVQCHHPHVAHAPRITKADVMAEIAQRQRALDAWAEVLRDHAEREVRLPCAAAGTEQRGWWTSDEPSDRLLAIDVCKSCEVVAPCLDAARARRESDHVLGSDGLLTGAWHEGEAEDQPQI